MEYQKPIMVPATANTPRFVSALYERIQPLTPPAFQFIFASNHFHMSDSSPRGEPDTPGWRLGRNPTTASRRGVDHSNMDQSPARHLSTNPITVLRSAR